MQIPGGIHHDLGVIFLVRVEAAQDPHAQRIAGSNGGFEFAQDLNVVTNGLGGLEWEPLHTLDYVEALQHGNCGWRGFESAGPAWIEETVGLAAGASGSQGEDRCKFAVLMIHCIRLLAEFNRWRTAYRIHRPDGTQT